MMVSVSHGRGPKFHKEEKELSVFIATPSSFHFPVMWFPATMAIQALSWDPECIFFMVDISPASLGTRSVYSRIKGREQYARENSENFFLSPYILSSPYILFSFFPPPPILRGSVVTIFMSWEPPPLLFFKGRWLQFPSNYCNPQDIALHAL